MEWALMYSGRPSSSRPRNPDAESPTSVAEREKKQAEDFVNGNSDVPLEELAAQNQELQRLKIIEYHKLKAKKCPTLDEQPRGPDGRIIFSDEYIDFMFYRDLQPLVDLRILQHTEEIIKQRIREQHDAKGDKDQLKTVGSDEVGKKVDAAKEPSTSSITSSTA